MVLATTEKTFDIDRHESVFPFSFFMNASFSEIVKIEICRLCWSEMRKNSHRNSMVMVRIPAASPSHRKASSPTNAARLSARGSVKIPSVHQTRHRSRMPQRVLNAAFYSLLCLSCSPRAEIAIVRDGKASERATGERLPADRVPDSRRAQSFARRYNKIIRDIITFLS